VATDGCAWASHLDNKVNHGDVGGGHAESNPVELALELGQHQGDGLGGSGGGGHNTEGSGPSTAQVAVRGVQQALVTRVRVGCGHGALDHTAYKKGGRGYENQTRCGLILTRASNPITPKSQLTGNFIQSLLHGSLRSRPVLIEFVHLTRNKGLQDCASRLPKRRLPQQTLKRRYGMIHNRCEEKGQAN
jgi:hypothetical protein